MMYENSLVCIALIFWNLGRDQYLYLGHGGSAVLIGFYSLHNGLCGVVRVRDLEELVVVLLPSTCGDDRRPDTVMVASA